MKQDDYKITDADYIAWCKMCTLASYMKDCKHCRFNIGLPFKAAINQEKAGGLWVCKECNIMLGENRDTCIGCGKPRESLIQHLAEIKPAVMSISIIK